MRHHHISWLIVLTVVSAALVVAATPVAAQQRVTLRFSDWHLTEDVWNKSLTEGMAIFEKRFPHIKVQMEPISYREKETKYTVESAAGKAPDVMHLHAFSLPAFYEKRYAMDLTPFIEKEGKGFLDAWYPLSLELVKYKGRVHAMPGDYMTMVLVCNVDMLKEAGVDPERFPTSWEGFLEFAKKATKPGQQWGLGMVGAKDPGFSLRFSPFLWTFGGDYLTADLKRSALDTPEAREAFTYFVELSAKHKVVPPGATAANPQDVRTQLAHKKIACEIGSGWTAPIVNKINPDLRAFDVLKAYPLPVKKKRATAIWLSSWIIGPNTKHPNEAWELVKFISSKEMELKWFQDNRVTSSRKDVSGVAPEILNDKFAKVIAAELPYGKVEPQIKEWPEIMDTFTGAVQEALTEAKTPDQALADAHARINTILARRR
jgi:multiple sugar transport system substrate-binding protein